MDCVASSAPRLGILYDVHLSNDGNISYGTSCYLHGETSSVLLDWETGYSQDYNCITIINALKSSNGKAILDTIITSVKMGYRQYLRKNLVHMIGNKLTLFKPVNMKPKYITLIILPSTLRCNIFSHYHAGPSGGHMGEYKHYFASVYDFFGLA